MENSKEAILKRCNAMCKNTLMETLEIEFIDFTENSLTARMPVTPKVHQPDGVLHGGASVALAESVGSAGAYIFLDSENFMIRGIEISANHVKSVRDGFVDAVATLIHKGRTTQLWQIKILNSDKELVSLIKLMTITIPAKKS
ncbi:PaaI family thioesterase [Planktosalinus lacus]|uniref:Thioesterase n=1 Tax=Planktosalinus lacus TaxID=1526573 RepID=A0A8J2VA89_9FLAO|nr:hotdog fold thioesterase [Planktosalinus lacus]GGD91038.1 thioesterase [Planktosalinus lacus]